MGRKRTASHFHFVEVGPSNALKRFMCIHCKDETNLVSDRKEQKINHLKNCAKYLKKTVRQIIEEGLPNIPDSEFQSSAGGRSTIFEKRVKRICRGVMLPEDDLEALQVRIADNDALLNIARQLLPVNARRKLRFQLGIVRFIASKNLPFNIVRDPWFVQSYMAINPFAEKEMPSVYMCKKILKEEVAEIEKNSAERFRFLANPTSRLAPAVTLAVDSWVSVAGDVMLGTVLQCRDYSYCTSDDIGSFDEDGIATARLIEQTMKDMCHRFEVAITNFVSDDASQNSKARKILALRHPQVIFQRCLAHQINLICGEVFRTLGTYVVVADLKKSSEPFGKERGIENALLTDVWNIMELATLTCYDPLLTRVGIVHTTRCVLS